MTTTAVIVIAFLAACVIVHAISSISSVRIAKYTGQNPRPARDTTSTRPRPDAVWRTDTTEKTGGTT